VTRVLDLFCGAGGAAMGLHRAWPHAEIIGVDIKPQPRYPFHFCQADAMTYPLEGLYDFIWASPPCQHYSQCTPKRFRKNHPDLIAATRRRLESAGVPYCIENVPSAKHHMDAPLMLCGSMFGLKVQRHRYFETSPAILLRPECKHDYTPVLITGTHRRTYEPRYEYSAQDCREAADLHWMTRTEMDQAIPPAYSEFIARQIMSASPGARE
jgi:DNA (cytosine-5)-methyltransferase 1